eukprot:TRINITY_DN14128_c0_g1_i1.p1 TRINITY_DN14128_c0_g1~~TRINITY_DN14128_c0_g1_i1.p1  ORF type:complete len:239 (+),score=28.27 TRINITY_DN14128_c0_g1_i1:69-785(+)
MGAADGSRFAGLAVFTAAAFLPEVLRFAETGRYTPHTLAPDGAFDDWSQPPRLNTLLHVHAAACFAWIGLSIYQLRSRGKGAHKPAGYAAGALCITSILAANLSAPTTIPAAHRIAGVPVFDFFLHGAWLSLTWEFVRGVLDARRGNAARHARRMSTCIAITSAPATYRALVAVAMRIDTSSVGNDCLTSLVHEGCISAATALSIALFPTRSVSGKVAMALCIAFALWCTYLRISGWC